MDGLLIDSEKVYFRCWKMALNKLNLSMTDDEILELRSLDSRLANAYFLNHFNDDSVYGKVRTLRKELMSEEINKQPLAVKPGVKELISYLKTNNIDYGIVTSSPQKRAMEYMRSVGLDGYFETIISTERVEKGKPYPDVYMYACKVAGRTPQECIAVEDSPNGLKSAHDAGLKTIMIPDLTPYSQKMSEYVDWCFEKLDDIISSDVIY